jgi:hypothetical protein
MQDYRSLSVWCRIKIPIMRFISMLALPVVLASVAGCEQRGPTVYVLEGEQTVELKASATPSRARVGETVVLHVEQRTQGNWKQIARNELKPGQCWVYRPPAEVEPEVAHSVQWEVIPEDAVRFPQEYQLNQSRVAIMMVKGTVKLTPIAKVKCEEGRTVVGPTVEIEVT